MKKVKTALSLVMVSVLIIITLLAGGCSTVDNTKLQVVASTSLITQIVNRVGGDMIDIINIIPPAQCPGHFDVKPTDIQKLSDAKLFLCHGWQGEMFTDELIAAADNDDLKVVRLDVMGNWMTPQCQLEATEKITDALIAVDGAHADAYLNAAEAYTGIINAKAAELETRFADEDYGNLNVLCSDQQMGFLVWMGFNVVQTFGRPDTLTPQVVQELVDLGRADDVCLVIDNMQSGQDAGKEVAEEIGCGRVILSNFPGGYDDTDTWEEAIDYNVTLLTEAIS